ncbi:hypothetical protein LPB72_03505 [Hydrogenophaga crassostreae]|uniref:DUF2158 domain-containing protein n=1 Tax=Hydrogenophaga crassostreae TaxID=1763535 RepID=A0A167IUJ8_9BURK|nr:hypothetical protein [Hydrogenophaga crassostreae]AOW14371.1 hypothetical protein LPB072_17530 [Hydrogenophaga crassostreae]OAD43606.1 hypothetical protein LPB72_03505 [Hydrogenophaga crassostreae]
MTQTARIVGPLEYREGDGPAIEIREGPVEVAITDLDVTLSWVEGDAHGSAAMPAADFQRYVDEGKIELNEPEAAVS